MTCEQYWKNAGARSAKATSYCEGYDFTDPNSIYGFLNITWYNWSENEAKNAIGCTTSQLENFYDASASDSFMSAVIQATTDISSWYGCSNATNCTAEELTAMQWGSFSVTNNPNPVWGDYYTP